MDSNEVLKLVSDEELDSAWGNADFGGLERRDVVRHALLKCASGYYQGFTSKQIITALGLITPGYVLTKKGKEYLWAAFKTMDL